MKSQASSNSTDALWACVIIVISLMHHMKVSDWVRPSASSVPPYVETLSFLFLFISGNHCRRSYTSRLPERVQGLNRPVCRPDSSPNEMLAASLKVKQDKGAAENLRRASEEAHFSDYCSLFPECSSKHRSCSNLFTVRCWHQTLNEDIIIKTE